MPEYVYALHDFIPENEDEVSFRAGERIEVVERDDLYGDGWWQGRNLTGKVGLFPVSYTTPAAPLAVPSNSSSENDDDDTGLPANQPTDLGPKTVLNTLPEESESGSPRPDANHGIIAPVPKAAPAKFLNGNHHDFERTSNDDDDEVVEDEQRLQEGAEHPRAREPPAGDQVMKATLTDVQKAIEQLGRRNLGGGAGAGAGSDLDDGNHSFSFASTGGDRDDTDTDFDLSDIDAGENGDDDVEGWHKGARMKLAEKARRAIEEAEKLEAMMGGGANNGGGGGIASDTQRAVAPPIEVEMSDESEDEDEREGFTSRTTAFQGIPEEPEEDETDGDVPSSQGREVATTSGVGSSNEDTAVSLVLPDKDETQVDTATATRSTFRISSPPIDLAAIPAVTAAAERERIPDSEAQSRSSTSSSRPLQRPPSANRNHQDHIKPASPSPVPFPSPAPSPENTQIQRAGTPQEQQQRSFESTPTIPTIPTNFFKSVSNPPPHSPTTGTAVSFISQPAQAQPRAMSPPFINTSSTQSKHASGTSAGSRNSGMAAIPPASPEPTSPLPPIPAAPLTPAPVPMQAVNSTMTTSTTIRPAASPPPITTFSHHHVPPPVIVPIVEEKKKEKHPSEWTLEEVIDWLKSKGFDQDVCDKFTEQEITGDVLLELDVNLLKSEIGIMAFGKRVRISNAITDLRRPPSITYSDHQSGAGAVTVIPQPRSASPVIGSGGHYTPLSPNSQIHSRTQSQSHSFAGSIPHGQGLGHAYSQSIQSSLGSPLGFTGAGGGLNGFNYAGGSGAVTPAGVNGNGAVQMGNVLQPGPLVEETPSPVGGEYVNVPQADGVGLGGPDGRGLLKPRPAQLSLSPSDGALKAHATEVKPKLAPAESEERGHMSDGDVVPASSRMRRRLFGRSHDSASSSRRQSKDMSPMASPTILPDHKDKEKEKEKDKEREGSVSSGRHGKGKRSMDGGKSGDRLSIFGGTFGGSLSKARKPPPSADDIHTEKTSMFSLPRLHSGSVRKSSSTHRSSTPTSPPAKAQKDFGELSPKALKERESRDSTVLRKRTVSSGSNANGTVAGAASDSAGSGLVKPGQSILEQIGEPDHAGWMRKKGDRYNSWKNRYFVLKGPHMYCLRSDSKAETKIKGYVHIVGYKVSVDENLDPGRYGFRIDHDSDKTHYFSSDEKAVVRDWMKAIMKATIDRDYTKPVVSSCNIPTIPLTVAQAMNPAPRPPSPTARAATQKALRRGDPNQLSTRDAQILMGLSDGSPNDHEPYQQDPSFPATSVANKLNALNAGPPPPRPSRDVKRSASIRSSVLLGSNNEDALIDWANSHLPPDLHVLDSAGPLFSGLALLRLAESIKGKPSSPPVPDSAFPVDANDDKLDGLFRLFDFLLDNDVKMGSVSINDVRQNKRDKVVQLLKALKAWEDKRRAILQSIGKGAVQAGGFVAF